MYIIYIHNIFTYMCIYVIYIVSTSMCIYIYALICVYIYYYTIYITLVPQNILKTLKFSLPTNDINFN